MQQSIISHTSHRTSHTTHYTLHSEEKVAQLRNFSGGRNTVPQIFFNSLHLGGNDDVLALDEAGTLTEKVEMVKTTAVTMMMDHWFHPWY
jgi:glutaredoxin